MKEMRIYEYKYEKFFVISLRGVLKLILFDLLSLLLAILCFLVDLYRFYPLYL